MRGPKPDPLSLTEGERTELERVVRRHSTGQQLALRGRIILEANAGKNKSKIVRELGIVWKRYVLGANAGWPCSQSWLLISRLQTDSAIFHVLAGGARSRLRKSAS
jgi:hypothetical protein